MLANALRTGSTSPQIQLMKKIITLSSILVLCCSVQAADTSVTLKNVHLCCNSCVKGVDKAVSGVNGSAAQCDKDAHTVVITAPDEATAQKAVDALVDAGYFGASSNSAIKAKQIGRASCRERV